MNGGKIRKKYVTNHVFTYCAIYYSDKFQFLKNIYDVIKDVIQLFMSCETVEK